MPEYQAYVDQHATDISAAPGRDRRGQTAARPRRGCREPPPTHRPAPPRAGHPRRPAGAPPAGSSARRAPTTSRRRSSTSPPRSCFLAAAAIEFALMRVQLIVPEQHADPARDLQPADVELSGDASLVLFAIPLALGLISYIVPLQIGARGVALPRLNQLSYWLYAAGAFTLYASFLYSRARDRPGRAAAAGRRRLLATPTASTPGSPAMALAPSASPASRSTWSSRCGSMRAPGMAWRRLPLFAWSATVITWLLLVIGPVMLAALTMLMIDRHFDGIFFDSEQGGAPLLYAAPRLDLLHRRPPDRADLRRRRDLRDPADVRPQAALQPPRRARRRSPAIAALGLLAWMQNMYTAPIAERLDVSSRWRSRSRCWCRSGSCSTLDRDDVGRHVRLAGGRSVRAGRDLDDRLGLAGELAYSVIPVGWELDNTTAAQGDTLYVLVGGGVIGGFAALHYWFPKLSGRLLGEGIGKAALGLIFVGILLYVIPMFLAGLEGQAVDVYKYFADQRRRRLQPDRLDRRLHARDRDPARARKRRPQLAQRAQRPRPRPVGRRDARVVRALAAAAAQLRRRPGRPQPRAAARHQRPRSGREPSTSSRRSRSSGSVPAEPEAEPADVRRRTGRDRRRRGHAGSLTRDEPCRLSWRWERAGSFPPPRHRDDRRDLRADPDRRDRPGQRLRPRLRRRGQRHPRVAALRGRRPARVLRRVGRSSSATGSRRRSSSVLIGLMIWRRVPLAARPPAARPRLGRRRGPRPRPGGARRADGREGARGRARRRPPRRSRCCCSGSCSSFDGRPTRRPPSRRRRCGPALRPLAVVTSCLVLATIVAGGYVAGTEYHGTPQEHAVAGAHTACGPAGTRTSSPAATARAGFRSASRGSPTSSSPIGCSCT